ncbi:hypothetical protein [Allopusillimonas ginsengisoli]|uniref:hypothetical protein n=1 Tax=Allopusillimonas ginsengisoli TaxID=453575 RepID=UPI0010217A64|nr:hypothetical protein [Allopusillimonas ginsengisoli]TEA79324.1 hypothetical protein ERE07_08115 [Allopusillimonas ginsengisoli]
MNPLVTLLLAAAALATVPGQGFAAVLPPEAQQAHAQQSTAFIEAAGFIEADINRSCSEAAFYTRQRFPQLGKSAFRPDADLDALAKAVLLVDCAEGPLPHARYLIRYHLAPVSQASAAPREYIEVLRSNLGPQRYQDVIRHVEREFWPPESIFGVGPNLAWRFVFGSVQGNRAHVERASRAELNQTDASKRDCLGEPCLSAYSPTDPSDAWHAFTPPALSAAAFREPNDAGLPGPPRVAQMLFLNATGGSGQAEPSESASIRQPEMVFRISKNVSGQDSGVTGLLHHRGLMDDAVSELWTLLHLSLGSGPEWRRKVVHRAGRQ